VLPYSAGKNCGPFRTPKKKNMHLFIKQLCNFSVESLSEEAM